MPLDVEVHHEVMAALLLPALTDGAPVADGA